MNTDTEKPKYYTPAVKKAIDKYRAKNIDKYNELQRNYYSEIKVDEEWRIKFNERCKLANKRYREKIKEQQGEVKPRGRPRKKNVVNVSSIANSTNDPNEIALL
tara:strand:+ start:871 stop:1182 length:312 start_codon:yes stop_codon:yes gene_type:complete